jgi:lipid IVA palmitoyltransferase
MKKFLFLLAACLLSSNSYACFSIIAKPCEKMLQALAKGDEELIVPGYAYHLRSSYSAEKIATFNELAWGIGYARTITDPDGDQHSVFWMVFKDSHRANQFNFGYVYQTYWGEKDSVQLGLGYTAMMVARPDIFKGVPFPAVVPMASVKYKKYTLYGIFLPKVNDKLNNGNVAFAFAKYNLE